MVTWSDLPENGSCVMAWLIAIARSSILNSLPSPPYVGSSAVHGKELLSNCENVSTISMDKPFVGLVIPSPMPWYPSKSFHKRDGGGAHERAVCACCITTVM